MQEDQSQYDVAVVGGGLGGLALAIQMARENYKVVLFEKEKYPFHKVCGEYISMESWNFLEALGIPLSTLCLPLIDTLKLSAPNGRSFTTRLPLGGFGISRYMLDDLLSKLAREQGVELLEETKVEDVFPDQDQFHVQYISKNNTSSKKIAAKICFGAFGKRSNLDIKWKREFISNSNTRLNNYVAIKYHVKTKWPANVIGLHNFENGYCGISKIEADKYCLCYLTTAANLKNCGNSISKMQENILYKNPVLKNIFSSSEFIFDTPLTISQISFSRKSLVENNMVMLGDAAGMIAPLCGNGMSMALHSSKIAAICVEQFLQRKLNMNGMQLEYASRWKKEFSKRLKAGRVLQSFFGSVYLSNFFVTCFSTFPFLAKSIIRNTHGSEF